MEPLHRYIWVQSLFLTGTGYMFGVWMGRADDDNDSPFHVFWSFGLHWHRYRHFWLLYFSICIPYIEYREGRQQRISSEYQITITTRLSNFRGFVLLMGASHARAGIFQCLTDSEWLVFFDTINNLFAQ